MLMDKTSKVRNIRLQYRRQFMLTAALFYKWNTIKIRLPRLITNAPYGSNIMTILDFHQSLIDCLQSSIFS